MDGNQTESFPGGTMLPKMPFRDRMMKMSTNNQYEVNAWRHTHFGNVSSRTTSNPDFFYELQGRVKQYFEIMGYPLDDEGDPLETANQQTFEHEDENQQLEEDREFALVLNEEWAQKFRETEKRRQETNRSEQRHNQTEETESAGPRKGRPKPNPTQRMLMEVYPPNGTSVVKTPTSKEDSDIMELQASLDARFDNAISHKRPLLWPEA